MKLVDTHAHLMDPAFAADLPAVMARAVAAGVTTIICVGYDLPSSRAAVALAAQWPQLWATVGIHPNYLGAAPPTWRAELMDLARAPRVVAIGETGLDYYRNYTPAAVQRQGFEDHLALAAALGLPVIVHCREAEPEVVALLQAYARPAGGAGVWHCFSGAEATMHAAVAAGYYISFAGPLTFKSAEPLRAVAACVPHDRLLVETDAPYLSPAPFRGQRNEPARVCHTAERLAALHGLSLAELAGLTTRNAYRLFHRLGEAAA
ncbi:MAG TPA: TatD family hydrolase [Chloroflexota bacterium]|nr:TatD family hydrolase [Chloroflexota bacterium]